MPWRSSSIWVPASTVIFFWWKRQWGLASCDRPLSPERVCSANSIQDGDSSLSAILRPRREFSGFHRPEGRIFSDSRSSVVEEAIEVSVGGSSLPVQGPVLRPVDCSSGLHQDVWSSLCMVPLPQDSSSQVPGRLAGPHSRLLTHSLQWHLKTHWSPQVRSSLTAGSSVPKCLE